MLLYWLERSNLNWVEVTYSKVVVGLNIHFIRNTYRYTIKFYLKCKDTGLGIIYGYIITRPILKRRITIHIKKLSTRIVKTYRALSSESWREVNKYLRIVSKGLPFPTLYWPKSNAKALFYNYSIVEEF